ncbi:RNA polymerase sigma factor [Limihaloglobus sulfuriphilus]|nr:sigma-70 family RNA polymerase sigma factor [Limihaloglobus sulfuriphilus]
MTDKQLARAAANGDRAAFDEIMNRYLRRITMYAAARTNNIHDAEDIAQDTFLRLLQYIDTFDDKYPFHTWLFTIAYRVTISNYSKKRTVSLADVSVSDLISNQDESPDNDWIWGAARKIGNESFTVLWLYYKEEMSTAQIAKVMNRTHVWVRVSLHRSRNKLATILKNAKADNSGQKWCVKKKVSVERI